ncbi:MAG: hypothetical protein MI866_10250, partial [Bacteroidales bacterium]|nr:hypothetical protein [Bacteroidales bacterium]
MRLLNKITILCLLLFQATQSNAQENDEKHKTQFGLTSSLIIEGVAQNAKNEYIHSIISIPQVVGIYAKHKNAEVNVDLGFTYIGGKLNYTVYKGFGIEAGISTALHLLTIERDLFSYDYYNGYVDYDIDLTQYYGGITYGNKLFD